MHGAAEHEMRSAPAGTHAEDELLDAAMSALLDGGWEDDAWEDADLFRGL